MLKISFILQLSWAIRALLLRNHPQLTRATTLFLKLLTTSDSSVAKSSAMLFSDAVAGKNCDFMSYNKTFASLARQKLFTLAKPRLIEAFGNEQNASSCLKSILCQLDHLPKSVISAEITELVPVLVKGLSVQETDVLYETLSALRQLLQQVCIVSFFYSLTDMCVLYFRRRHRTAPPMNLWWSWP